MIGLVVILIICRGGKGVAGAPLQWREKKIARRWQEVLLPANLRSISHAHQIQQQASTRYVLMIDTLAIDFRAARQICCKRHLQL